MKKTILMIAMAVFSTIIMAQEKNSKKIPQKITDAFSSKYPSARIKDWKIGKAGYIAEFIFEKKKYLAYYSSNADWLRTETKIKLSSRLPHPVKEALNKSEYASWYITEMKQIERPGKFIYLVHVNDGNKLSADHHDALKVDLALCFSETGELINKQRLHSAAGSLGCNF